MSLFDSASIVVTPNAYKASKLYAIKPTDGSGDLTVVRATTARRVNSAGLIESVANNVPRLDYTNSTCPSILVEPQRTNLVLRSEEFDNSPWGGINTTVTPNSIIAPNGSLTADKLVDNTTNDIHQLSQAFNLNSATTYVFSFFAKKGEINTLALILTSVGMTQISSVFNIENGTITSGTNATIENYGNGWYRINQRLTTVTGGLSIFRIRLKETSGYSGNGTDGLYLWGAQLEVGANATSYIPTTTASVTRNADVISKTNGAFLPTSYPFTIYSESVFSINNSFSYSFLNSSVGDNYYTVRLNNNKIEVLTRQTSEVITQSTNNFNLNTYYRIAVVWTSSNVYLYVNGNLEKTSTNTITFNSNVNDLFIGQLRPVPDTGTRTPIKLLSIWNKELTSDECINLTTI